MQPPPRATSRRTSSSFEVFPACARVGATSIKVILPPRAHRPAYFLWGSLMKYIHILMKYMQSLGGASIPANSMMLGQGGRAGSRRAPWGAKMAKYRPNRGAKRISEGPMGGQAHRPGEPGGPPGPPKLGMGVTDEIYSRESDCSVQGEP